MMALEEYERKGSNLGLDDNDLDNWKKPTKVTFAKDWRIEQLEEEEPN